MSEAEKKIEEYIEEAYVGLRDDEQAPFTVGDLKAETRDDIEFGYRLGKDEYKAALRREIERLIEPQADVVKRMDEFEEEDVISAAKYVKAYRNILELLDTVEP